MFGQWDTVGLGRGDTGGSGRGGTVELGSKHGFRQRCHCGFEQQ